MAEKLNRFQQQFSEVVSVPIYGYNSNEVIHSNKIVLWGASCVGKTTFAYQLKEHLYYCFDALFPWYPIEFLGVDINSCLHKVQEACQSERFVLDGWHLHDSKGYLLPRDVSIYVIYIEYDKMIRQYRVPVKNYYDHWNYYHQWYSSMPSCNIRYFKNLIDNFKETNKEDFDYCISSQLII